MNAEYYDELWLRNLPGASGTAEFWDRRAETFNAHKNEGESLERRRGLANRLADQAGLGPGGRVLDIGCGSGHYSLLLAGRATEVAAFDFSPEMIRYARENAQAEGCRNVDFEVLDWRGTDLAARGWHKRFDLVLACKTPAVNNLATLEKMMAACRGLCCLVTKVDTKNTVRDRLRALLGIREEADRTSLSFYCAFNLLWLKGFYPEVWYLDESWENNLTLDDARVVYGRYFERFDELGPDGQERIASGLSGLATDGRIREAVESKVIVMTWRPHPDAD